MSADDARHRDALVRQVQAAESVEDLFITASRRLRRHIWYDGAAWLATDPVTGLPTAPARIEYVDHRPDICLRTLDRELHGEDAQLFRDLARATVPAASLQSLVDHPRTKARSRDLAQFGMGDELRFVLRVGATPWAVVALWRRADRPAFTPKESRFVATLSAPLAETMRMRSRSAPVADGIAGRTHPGVLLFDGQTLTAADEQARHWLSEVPGSELSTSTDLDIAVPVWLAGVVSGAAVSPDRTARSRLRTRAGQWLVCHASRLSGERVVAVIEPATATEIGSVIAGAYELSEREQQVVRLVARGADTRAIAAELRLSAHTVRDHLKLIFAKVEVSSRGELVARLFTDHFWATHRDGAAHVEP